MLLILATWGMPVDRADWARAMQAELAQVHDRRARWRFSLGCSRAALTMRSRECLALRAGGSAGVRSSVLAAIAAAFVLGVIGLVRYPQLHAGLWGWASVAAFATVLFVYAALALTLSRGAGVRHVAARRYGFGGGLMVGLAWLWILAPAEISKTLIFLPLAVALLAPLVAAVLARRSGADAQAAMQTALWTGLTGALLAFIVWVIAAYASDGRPYDPQLLRDFHHSGSHDLAAFAVGDDLGTGLALLVIVPLVAFAIGCLQMLVASQTSSTRQLNDRS